MIRERGGECSGAIMRDALVKNSGWMMLVQYNTTTGVDQKSLESVAGLANTVARHCY